MLTSVATSAYPVSPMVFPKSVLPMLPEARLEAWYALAFQDSPAQISSLKSSQMIPDAEGAPLMFALYIPAP
jgi:hypothetical protein